MHDRNRRARLLSAWRSAVIAFAGLCVFAIVIGLPHRVFAAEDSIKNILPAPGFATDWVMQGQVALFDADSLFDHINGEAELFFPYGFERLATATYLNRKDPEVWVVVDVYRMDSLLNAFGIYSNYRKRDAERVLLGADGFVSPSQLMFYQATYFVRIQVTGAEGLDRELLAACGRAVSANLPIDTRGPRELEILAGMPGVVTRSERYIARSLLGYAFFQRGIVADFILEGERVQVFVVFENSIEAARKALDDYRAYLTAEGREANVTSTTGHLSLTAVDPLYQGVFVEQTGPHLIGTVRMKDASAGKLIVDKIRGRLLGRQ